MITKDIKPGYCQCGKPLHYSSPELKDMMDSVVKLAGDPFTIVTITGKGSWRIQRHYLALHGIKGQDDLDAMGFERVSPPEHNRKDKTNEEKTTQTG